MVSWCEYQHNIDGGLAHNIGGHSAAQDSSNPINVGYYCVYPRDQSQILFLGILGVCGYTIQLRGIQGREDNFSLVNRVRTRCISGYDCYSTTVLTRFTLDVEKGRAEVGRD